jgi:hypothetical protein
LRGALATRDRLREPANRDQRRADLVLVLRGGFQRGGSFVGAQRCLKPSLVEENIAQACVRLRIIRTERYRVFELSGGFADPVQGRERQPEIVVEWRKRLARNRAADQLDGLVMLAALVRNDAEQVQAVGVARIVLKNLTVCSFRFRKLPGAMLVDREREQPVGVCAGHRGH